MGTCPDLKLLRLSGDGDEDVKGLYQIKGSKRCIKARAAAGNQLPTTHRRYFYPKLPYRPDYIGYWQLGVPDFS